MALDNLPAVRGHGDTFVAPLARTAQFSEGISRHHRPFYSDYDAAKMHILQAVGDLTDFEVFGRGVLCAVFCRPNVTPGGIYIPVKEIKEDWWQHKAALILKTGPDAFSGDDTYLRAMFGAAPKPEGGDWVFSNASSGIQMNVMGDGASRPRGKDHRGEEMDIFEWDGWPCRIIGDENFLGRVVMPHSVV